VAGREREAREPGLAYLLVELVPDSAGEPWGAADDATDNVGAPMIMVPFTPCDPEEHAEQVRHPFAGMFCRGELARLINELAALGGCDHRGC